LYFPLAGSPGTFIFGYFRSVFFRVFRFPSIVGIRWRVSFVKLILFPGDFSQIVFFVSDGFLGWEPGSLICGDSNSVRDDQ